MGPPAVPQIGAPIPSRDVLMTVLSEGGLDTQTFKDPVSVCVTNVPGAANDQVAVTTRDTFSVYKYSNIISVNFHFN